MLALFMKLILYIVFISFACQHKTGTGDCHLVIPVTLRPLPEKVFRRRKAGRYSVKKSVLFERSEFTDFRNTARLFSFWRLRT